MVFDGDTVTHGWIVQRGPIHLRHTERKRIPPGGGGIILAALVGANLVLWFWILARWLP